MARAEGVKVNTHRALIVVARIILLTNALDVLEDLVGLLPKEMGKRAVKAAEAGED